MASKKSPSDSTTKTASPPASTSEGLTEQETRVEQQTQAIGRHLWEHLERSSPSMFERRWWDDRIMEWAMEDESVKIQMFRFVDVLPTLRGHESVSRHLQEYFEEVRDHLPWAARLGMKINQPNSILGRAFAWNARSNARRMASRFIAGTTVEEVTKSVRELRKNGFAFSLDLLGEAIISDVEADRYLRSYLDLITGLAPTLSQMPEQAQIDTDAHGHIPRTNVSVKLSALDSQFRPVDREGSTRRVGERLRTLLRTAIAHDVYLHVDMEHYAFKDLTLHIFKEILAEEEFRDYPHVGIVIQVYLPEAEADLEDLLAWVKQRGTPITIRLVKGAYWDYETIIAEQHGWPIPVYQRKWESDANFERQAKFLMTHHEWLRPALGSHNLRSLANAIAWANELDVPQDAYEIQVLYGMAEDQAQLFREQGYRVRVYTPFGELIPGMAYLVRRLLENTSNDSFLRMGHDRSVSATDLLRSPIETGKRPPAVKHPEPVTDPSLSDDTMSTAAPPFQNEPLLDFARDDHRDAMAEAIDDVAGRLGEEYPLVIDGKSVSTSNSLISRNPAKTSEVIGTVASATAANAQSAIDAALRAYGSWSKQEVRYRVEYLELIADEIRSRRYELAAWIVYEVGKTWAEADGDVAEAIDFCVYYAAQMQALVDPLEADVPGEDNRYFYRSRGVTVVIAPWNFPLAILTGMTAAALVTGNTVVMKPAEQSSVVAAKLMEIFGAVGLPDGVVNFLPGIGEEVGPVLVESPDVDLIAFTGSREVGLAINERAAATRPTQTMVKKVIAEMGGKNAIIVDDDADLDEAVVGVMESAFGFAGQKCSACSRVVVLKDAYEPFLERLIAATESLTLGEPTDSETRVGPVIDEEAVERITKAIGNLPEEAELVLSIDPGDLSKQGHFVGPQIITGVESQDRIAQQELFGPVLCVLKAKDIDEAIRIANDTDYALTGGIYSRSPANLKRIVQELRVGNLYLNRTITGALVARQPFGGYRMSGIGTKAGGPDYLRQFLIPVNITENTLRRGFAPESD